MARTSLIFSFAFTGFIMLSMSQITLGVSRFSQLLPQPDETVVVIASDSGGHGVDLEKGEVYHGSKIDFLDIANGVAVVKRVLNAKVNLKKGQVITGGKGEANIPGVELASVNKGAGAAVVVDTKSSKITMDLPMM
ncbi:hypothetical protein MKX01_002590 [Papaver californicum]|nr:hypothetical protein MKX01_002590 [Papaver californicum]